MDQPTHELHLGTSWGLDRHDAGRPNCCSATRASPLDGGCSTNARKDPCSNSGGRTNRDAQSISRSHPNCTARCTWISTCYPANQLMHQNVERFVQPGLVIRS
jgi:hypothetical protein